MVVPSLLRKAIGATVKWNKPGYILCYNLLLGVCSRQEVADSRGQGLTKAKDGDLRPVLDKNKIEAIKVIQTNLQSYRSSCGIQCNLDLTTTKSKDFYTGKIMYPRNRSISGNSLHDNHASDDDDDDDAADVDECNDDDDGNDDDDEDDDDGVSSDDEYHPPSSPENTSDEEMIEDENLENTTIPADSKFIVYWSKLQELFSSCPRCSGLCTTKTSTVGSLLRVQQDCACGFQRKWDSQPLIGAYPAGNLDISSAILFSGSIQSKVLRFLGHMGVKSITSRTYFNHQQSFLHHAVINIWNSFPARYLRIMLASNEQLVLGGDGRADTPGHSAKYGSYALLDLNHMLVADIQLFQSNEVKSSFHMEKEGLVRSVNFLKSKGLEIKELVTDRHCQITKYVREELPTIKHYYDVWHVAKGLKKKLTAISRLKDCGSLQPWIRSCTNNLYWVPVSTPGGDSSLMLEKWLSMLNHVADIHAIRGTRFPAC